ncbi:MAG: 23S rRNA (guanosine(2251)-2'-O)-methyltransferase RlmB [Firmicutes bacterium RBG_13_65_8]|nr:MAG: 23S rRNA (guanosine(2251)-2'-O)-methyltransferase RlmB [Firmicutes bacterium RBG_13_65_8]
MIAGRHAVVAALRGGDRVRRLYVARGAEPALQQEIAALAAERAVPVSLVDRSWLDARSGRVRHQGVLAEAAPLEYADLGELLAATGGEQMALILALDQVQDPQNLGAIIRTGAAAGAHGLVVPARRSAGLTGGALKAAAGTAETFPVARVTNLPRALEQLKRAGIWAAGADASAPTPYWEADFRRPLVLVIGGEDRGLGRLVREKCDFLVRIPMHKGSPCLNASVAAGILLFEAVRQRSCALLPRSDVP